MRDRERAVVVALDASRARARAAASRAERQVLVEAPVDLVRRRRPASISSAAIAVRLGRGVLVHEPAGVGDERRCRAPRRSRGVISTPELLARGRQTISAVHEASRTTRFTVPKRVLSWWWSMLRMCRPVALEEVDRHAVDVAAVEEHDRALVHVVGRRRATHVARAAVRWYSYGSGNSSGGHEHHASPCRAARGSRASPSSEPSASPSGFSWVVSRSFSRAAQLSSTCSCSVATAHSRSLRRAAR